VVRAGERYFHKQSMLAEPAVNGQVEVLHEDEALIVLNKPAPLPMHAGGRFNRNTLQYILSQVYHPQKPRPAHRLDANTTGVVLVTRTRHFAAQLQPQFEKGEVDKVYLARVQGCPVEDAFVCEAPISLEPGATGTRRVAEEGGLSARTEFRVIDREPGGTTLLEARPRTGRTNQIRVHLWQLGLPVWGDPAYLPNREIGEVQTLRVEAPPLCLHAWRLSCRHPLDGRRLEFTAPLPAWAKAG
jgi:RluA family pseudouridine synthase